MMNHRLYSVVTVSLTIIATLASAASGSASPKRSLKERLAIEMIFARPVFARPNPDHTATFSMSRSSLEYSLSFCLPAGRSVGQTVPMMAVSPGDPGVIIGFDQPGKAGQPPAFPSDKGTIVGYGDKTDWMDGWLNYWRRVADNQLIIAPNSMMGHVQSAYVRVKEMPQLPVYSFLMCRQMLEAARELALQPVYETYNPDRMTSLYTTSMSMSMSMSITPQSASPSPHIRVAFCTLKDGFQTDSADFDAARRPLTYLNNVDIVGGRVVGANAKQGTVSLDPAVRAIITDNRVSFPMAEGLGSVIGRPKNDMSRGAAFPVFSATVHSGGGGDGAAKTVHHFYYIEGDDPMQRYGAGLTSKWTRQSAPVFWAWPREYCS